VSSARVAAADSAERVQLEYVAPAGCPDGAQFEHEVRRFLPNLSLAQPGGGGRLLRVEVAADGRAGSLTLYEAGAAGVRHTSGETCEEVAQMLAFAVALAIDPHVQPPVQAAPAASAAASASPTAPALVVPEPSAPGAGRDRAPAANRKGPRWAVALNGTSATALAPHPSFGGGVAFESLDAFGGAMLRLGGSYSASEPVTVDDATVSFHNWLGLFEACPHVWRRAALAFSACLRVDAGVRTASAVDIPAGRSATRPWLALGPSAHGRWRLLAPLFIDAAAGLTLPALRDHVYLKPRFTVHDVPWLGFIGEIGLGVEFGDQNRD
jgi:hypothetical protein